MTITKGQVVTFVADKVVEYFKDAMEIPSKLEIQKCISEVTSGVEVAMGTKHVKETVFENGCKVTKEYDKEVTKPLIDYYVKISLSEVKAIQEEILKNIAQIRYPTIESKGTVSQALKELKKAAWMVKSDQIVDFVRAVAKAVVYSEGKWEGDEKYQEAIYLKSEVEGTGKSTLNELLMKGAEKVGLRTATGTYPNGRFGNLATYASNNLVVINDTSYESIRNINVDKMKSLLRREKVEHEMKGLDPVLVEPKSAIIAAGNIEPPIAGDRCWKVFDCIGLPVTELDEVKKREAREADLSLIFNVFNSFNIFNQANKNLKIFENKFLIKKDSLIKKDEKLARVPLLSFLLESLNKVKSCAIDFEKLTLKKFFDTLKETGTDLTFSQINGLTKAIKMLYAFGYITKENCAANEYIQWNVTKLFEINPEEIFVYSNESEDIYEEVRKTEEMWERLIAFFEKNEPTPPKKEETIEEMPTEEELKKEFADLQEENTTNQPKDSQTTGKTIGEIMEEEEEKAKEIGQIAEIDEKEVKYRVEGYVKEDLKGKRFVLKFTRKSDRQIFWKSYWVYGEEKGHYRDEETTQLWSDLQRVFMSKGRDWENNKNWELFRNRCEAAIEGRADFSLNSSCALEIIGGRIEGVYSWEVTK